MYIHHIKYYLHLYVNKWICVARCQYCSILRIHSLLVVNFRILQHTMIVFISQSERSIGHIINIYSCRQEAYTIFIVLLGKFYLVAQYSVEFVVISKDNYRLSHMKTIFQYMLVIFYMLITYPSYFLYVNYLPFCTEN